MIGNLAVAIADVAQLVEHHLAKVRVASSNLVIRSKKHQVSGPLWAAVLRFRLAGIPSRYTIGFVSALNHPS